eukprot:1159623-Pelagomonas_calceolata.AAC.7
MERQAMSKPNEHKDEHCRRTLTSHTSCTLGWKSLLATNTKVGTTSERNGYRGEHVRAQWVHAACTGCPDSSRYKGKHCQSTVVACTYTWSSLLASNTEMSDCHSGGHGSQVATAPKSNFTHQTAFQRVL